MPVCSYKGCTNSSKKKFKMNSFPRNPVQQAIWIKNMDTKDWKFYQGAVLCEAHFEPHMWEKIRVDGTKKLKRNAVPTIFGDRIVKESQLIEINSENMNTDDLEPIVIEDFDPIILESSTTPIAVPIVERNELDCIKIVRHCSSKEVAETTLTSILKPQLKAKNTLIKTIRVPKDILDQLKMANSKAPIIIPASSSILKSNTQSTNKESTENSTMQTEDIILNEAEVNTDLELSDSESLAPQTTINNDDLNEVEENITDSEWSDSESIPTPIVLNKTEAKKLADERFEKMDKLLLKQLKLNDALRKRLASLNNKLQRLTKENKDHKTFLINVFTDDQIRALELRHYNPKSTTTWSHKTMMKAMKLKKKCGTKGYEELLRQNLPLPSIRTISRWCTARNIPIP